MQTCGDYNVGRQPMICHCMFLVVYLIVLVKLLYRMMMIFTTIMATKLTMTAGVILIASRTPVI